MDLALIASALLMGLAGTPHCALMCGAACTGLVGGERRALWGFQLARLASYAAGGALAAASVGWAAQLGQASALLRPLWVMLHMAALGLGLYLLWRGRQPAWLEALGARSERAAAGSATVSLAGIGAGRAVTGRATLGGLAWLAWPCGLLQSALVVAALASGPAQGAAVMGAFGAASAPGLLLAPVLLRRGAGGMRWAVRLAGLCLAAASVWALGHGVWQQVADWCR
ncbi:sulfite exporter TauE/SafE family protein [Roseateles sp. DAIF2]|uniref:sulfite exporter TauE/SafE family protein n=1 Tax=Roseateles sp. DAIF2 TaxID=2714952 RepID=UPI0018A2D602|nr:sulfite exporter TauE/SafE family protein [Roseateles sp. DAIF2]QPF73293.1 sulfite exporter TauE/SafE family protein [Roseateles sp. DAIF2]